MTWTVPKLLAVGIVCAIAAAVSLAYQQKKVSPSPKVEMVAARAPSTIHAIKRRLAGTIVFVDPVTGAIRGPEPGELAELTGANTVARMAAAPPEPQSIAGSNGMFSIAPETMRTEFMTVTRNADGTLTYQCQNPVHRHLKGENHAR
jgi:hypothetical protein